MAAARRLVGLGIGILVASSGGAVGFQEGLITGTTAYEALSILSPLSGSFLVVAKTQTNPQRIHVLYNAWQDADVSVPWIPAVDGSVFGDAVPSLRTPSINIMSQSDPTSGNGYATPFERFTGRFFSTVTMSDPAGPVFAISHGVSVDPLGGAMLMFEVRPAVAARKIIVLNYQPGVQNYKRFYGLGVGESVIDCAPRTGGGLVFLTGTPSAAYKNYIDTSGTRFGPYLVGAASQIAYSPVNGGAILTAGSSAGNMVFSRSGLASPGVDTVSQPLPYANVDVTFRCSSAMDNGTCWWGGSYTTPGGDKNGFITATKDDGLFENFGSHIAVNQAFDESVLAIQTTHRGLGVWAADGALSVFDTATGNPVSSYPGSPDGNVHYRAIAVSNAAWANSSNTHLNIYSESYFGVVGYNTATSTSVLVKVSLPAELMDASSTPTVVGGGSPTVYARLYESVNAPLSFPASSSSPTVSVPPTLDFPNWAHVWSFTVQTQPVATAEEVEVRIGSPRSVIAKLTVLPPTPSLFTPASQTITGGQNTTSRLSLNGKAPTGGLPVSLRSDGPEVTVTATVLVPSGLYSRSFLIHTATVGSAVTRTITATYAGVSKTTAITVTP